MNGIDYEKYIANGIQVLLDKIRQKQPTSTILLLGVLATREDPFRANRVLLNYLLQKKQSKQVIYHDFSKMVIHNGRIRQDLFDDEVHWLCCMEQVIGRRN